MLSSLVVRYQQLKVGDEVAVYGQFYKTDPKEISTASNSFDHKN